MGTRILVAIGALASMTALALPASAQAKAASPPRGEVSSPKADALFVEGRKLFDARRFNEACDKLAESHRLSPTVKALGLLAACHEEQGKLATALAEYLETAARARTLKDTREASATKRAEAIRPAVPVLLIAVSQTEPGLSITQNGKAVAAGARTELYVDPGPVEIVAQAPGKRAWRTQVTAEPKGRHQVDIPALAAEAGEAPPPPPRPVPRRAPPPPPSGPPPVHVAGFIAGGFGIATLALASGFGIAALQANDVAKKDTGCNAKNYCTEASAALREHVFANANASTALFALGGAALTAGLTLIMLPQGPAVPAKGASRSIRVTASGDPRGGGVTISGNF